MNYILKNHDITIAVIFRTFADKCKQSICWGPSFPAMNKKCYFIKINAIGIVDFLGVVCYFQSIIRRRHKKWHFACFIENLLFMLADFSVNRKFQV